MKVQMKMEIKFYVDVTEADLKKLIEERDRVTTGDLPFPKSSLCLWAANDKILNSFPDPIEDIDVQETEIITWDAYEDDGSLMEREWTWEDLQKAGEV